MSTDLTDEELRARLSQLGARVEELKAARRPPPEGEHIRGGPLGPIDPVAEHFLFGGRLRILYDLSAAAARQKTK
jgi:hypothetical protein